MSKNQENDKGHNVLYAIAAVLVVIVLATLGSYFRSPMSFKGIPGGNVAATIPQQSFSYEIATSTAAQEQGLGGRPIIPANYGMLFVFPKDGTYGFWMKDMQTSIDMIWISSDGTMVGIAPDVFPSTYPSVFYPPVPVRYVMETRVGEAAAHGWIVGSKIPLPPPYGTSTSATILPPLVLPASTN